MAQEDFEFISVYTRTQAIADGTLINISETAKSMGYKFPMAITSNLAADLDGPGKLFWTLFRFAKAIEESPKVDKDLFVLSNVEGADALLHLGPSDNGEPVLTLMRPEDW